MMTSDELADEIHRRAELFEGHPDPVARLFSALKDVERVIFEKMLEIRKAESEAGITHR